MRFDRIELIHIKMILRAPFVTSMGVESDEEHIIVRVDGEGVTGWGESVAEGTPFYSYETVPTAWHILSDFLIPSVLGKDLKSVADALELYSKVRGHMMAKAGLEAALWDAFAKSQNLSLSGILGGVRKKIDAGVSIGIQESAEVMIRKVEGYLKEGYRRIKIKIAPGNDFHVVEALRKAYPDLQLWVDANSAYTLKDTDLFKKLDVFGLELIEQPLGYNDIYEHSKLQKQIKTALCLDESVHSLADTCAGIELGSCRIINIKPGRVGGFTEAKLIHDYCASKDVPVWCGGMLESGIGRAGNVALASLPNFTLPGDISSSNRHYLEEIVEPAFLINSDGTMNVPVGPGIGVEVNLSQLKKMTVRSEVFSASQGISGI
ncbi:MAG TPA: o-succinylbenzoate synthase [Prolixibacteraceae bacterium]|nr:o-succinylbenzoate synthase [Prolixibacteraceae bacterium]